MDSLHVLLGGWHLPYADWPMSVSGGVANTWDNTWETLIALESVILAVYATVFASEPIYCFCFIAMSLVMEKLWLKGKTYTTNR